MVLSNHTISEVPPYLATMQIGTGKKSGLRMIEERMIKLRYDFLRSSHVMIF